MGLDTVEMVMEVEEEFGVTIAAEAAAHCRTVGELAFYVYGQIQSRPAEGGADLESRRFDALRAVLAQVSPALAQDLRKESLIRDVLPRRVRRRFWSRAGVALPELRMPVWAVWAILLLALCVLIVFLTFFLIALRTDAWSGLVLSGAVAVVAGIVLYLLLLPARLEVPRHIVNFQDLVRGSLREELQQRKWPTDRASFEHVLLRVREIIAGQTGLSLEKVKPESSFVKDLEMG